jgi:hypothetical protein
MSKATLKGFGEGIDGIEVEIPDSFMPAQPHTNDELDKILEQFSNDCYSWSPDFYYRKGLKFLNRTEAKQAIKSLINKDGYMYVPPSLRDTVTKAMQGSGKTVYPSSQIKGENL